MSERPRPHELSPQGLTSRQETMNCGVYLCDVANGRCDGAWGHAGYWHTHNGIEYECTYDGQAEHARRQQAVADAEMLLTVREYCLKGMLEPPANSWMRGFRTALECLFVKIADADSAVLPSTEGPAVAKPPLDVKPRRLHEEHRLVALATVVQRCSIREGKEPDWASLSEWIEEMADITIRLAERYGSEPKVPVAAPQEKAPPELPTECPCHG